MGGMSASQMQGMKADSAIGVPIRPGLEAEIRQAHNRVNDHISNLNEVAARLEAFADIALGARNGASQPKETDPAVTPGFCGQLNAAMVDEERAINRIDAALERLGI
jgi:hypothetical protein